MPSSLLRKRSRASAFPAEFWTLEHYMYFQCLLPTPTTPTVHTSMPHHHDIGALSTSWPLVAVPVSVARLARLGNSASRPGMLYLRLRAASGCGHNGLTTRPLYDLGCRSHAETTGAIPFPYRDPFSQSLLFAPPGRNDAIAARDFGPASPRPPAAPTPVSGTTHPFRGPRSPAGPTLILPCSILPISVQHVAHFGKLSLSRHRKKDTDSCRNEDDKDDDNDDDDTTTTAAQYSRLRHRNAIAQAIRENKKREKRGRTEGHARANPNQAKSRQAAWKASRTRERVACDAAPLQRRSQARQQAQRRPSRRIVSPMSS
ncbi:hypothetical protein CDD83_918 [Cordyceps sp. RAO-2017]|nr:hypothetical protein CDD83_918 [Cordyceps sp. RAO-2017]